jgi:hypothetical protein
MIWVIAVLLVMFLLSAVIVIPDKLRFRKKGKK